MPSIPRIVYLPTIEPETWLLWTTSGEGSCLRDYRSKPATENRDYSTSEIWELLRQPKSQSEIGESIKHQDRKHWIKEINYKNAQQRLEIIDENSIVETRSRLLDLFVEQTLPLLKAENQAELSKVVSRWISNFACVVQKKDQKFNHWDDTDATGPLFPNAGASWLSAMLEHCRQGNKISFIKTGDSKLDFAVLSVQTEFAISSKNNLFQPGKEDRIKPDGLAVRSDKSWVVLEMKGPVDDPDPVKATLQALCGALALWAKRDMCITIAALAATRRPACECIAPLTPSVGLYMVIVPKPGVPPLAGNSHLKKFAQLIRAAFPQLRDIVYFEPAIHQIKNIGNLTPSVVV